MKKAKTALRLLLLLIVGAFVGLRVYGWNARNLTGDAVPMPFGVGASVVLSGSMEPELSVGDLLFFGEAEKYAPGDVVVYQSGRTPVVHRIVKIQNDLVITQGDANNTADEPFDSSLIKGRVMTAIPLVGYLFLALKTPVGTLLTIGGAVALMELSYRREQKEQDEKQEEIKAEIRRLMQELDQSEQ